MLEELSVQNFAIIAYETVEFNKGFTCLTGETGSGKSILMKALAFVLGSSQDVNLIRRGSKETEVSASFLLEDCPGVYDYLRNRDINLTEPRLLIRRTLNLKGKSSIFVEGHAFTKGELCDLALLLVDIHGQNQQQSLMVKSNHIKIVDSSMEEELSCYRKLYNQYKDKRKLYLLMKEGQEANVQEINRFQNEIKEIEEASLKEGEDVELKNKEKRLTLYEKLSKLIDSTSKSLDNHIVNHLKTISRDMENASSLDKELTTIKDRLQNLYFEALDISRSLRVYGDGLSYSSEALKEIQERLSLIYILKKKYALSVDSPIEEVLEYRKNTEELLQKALSFSKNSSSMEEELSSLKDELISMALDLRSRRKHKASEIETQVNLILKDLGMEGSRLIIRIEEEEALEENLGPKGLDRLEFFININGEDFPLIKTSSGGELSRIMLALKSVLTSEDTVPTLVFDEIDTGVGGEIAAKLGEYLSKLSKHKQIFCITHLASIAVCADNQLRICKNKENTSEVSLVEGEDRVQEISRMLSGDMDEVSRLHARTMLKI